MPHPEDCRTDVPTPLPHAVRLTDLSVHVLGWWFSPAFDACRRVAQAVAGEGWSVAAVHVPCCGTEHVFRFACPMASLRFSARATAIIGACRAQPALRNPD